MVPRFLPFVVLLALAFFFDSEHLLLSHIFLLEVDVF